LTAIPLTVPEIKRLLATPLADRPGGNAGRWMDRRRRPKPDHAGITSAHATGLERQDCPGQL